MDVIAGLVGVVIGSSVSLLSVFLNQRLIEKREDKKIDQKREEQAISEIYSPLVFLLDKTRELFVYVLSFKQALEVSSVTNDELKEASFALQYFTSKKLFTYPKVLEEILMHKGEFFDSKFFYSDMFLLNNYLSSIVDFISFLATKPQDNKIVFLQHFSTIGPISCELDEAISQMRKYALVRVMRKKREYEIFFDEEKIGECENYVNDVNVMMTGMEIPNWNDNLKQLGKIKKTEKST